MRICYREATEQELVGREDGETNIYKARVAEMRGRGRPRSRWTVGVRKMRSEKGMTIQWVIHSSRNNWN